MLINSVTVSILQLQCQKWKCSLNTSWEYYVLVCLQGFWTGKIYVFVWAVWIYFGTRSTQRVQTSLAEADHYSHIAHCKNVEPWWWSKDYPPKKKSLDHYLHHDLGMLPLLSWFFFAHLLILEYPDYHKNLISSSLYYPGPRPKSSSQSVHNFLNKFVHKQTNRQTNATKNITSFAKEVITQVEECSNKVSGHTQFRSELHLFLRSAALWVFKQICK